MKLLSDEKEYRLDCLWLGLSREPLERFLLLLLLFSLMLFAFSLRVAGAKLRTPCHR